MRFAKWFSPLVGAVALCMAVSCGEGPDVPDRGPAPTVTVKGNITDEGVECLALRDSADTLYTLAGATGEYGPGDEVCVKGEINEYSYCMQGLTIVVEWIGPAADCN
jgi:hypothetical protein